MTIPIPCDIPNCRLPHGHVINGALVIESQHYGKKHRCTISLEYLRNLLTQNQTVVLDSALTTVPAQKVAPPP